MAEVYLSINQTWVRIVQKSSFSSFVYQYSKAEPDICDNLKQHAINTESTETQKMNILRLKRSMYSRKNEIGHETN